LKKIFAKLLSVTARSEATRQSSCARERAKKTHADFAMHAAFAFLSAPAGAQLDCFAIGGAKRRRSSNGYGSQ
jgi:hypothetical protein